MPNFADTDIKRNNRLLFEAVIDNNIEEVKQLIPLSQPKDDQSKALRWAAAKGFVDIVKLLLPVSDPTDRNNEALLWAAENGHIECVKLFLSDSDLATNTMALIRAAKRGKTEMVKFLLPVSNSQAHDNQALYSAVYHNHKECIELLIPVSNYHLVLQKLQTHIFDTTTFQKCIENYEIFQLKEHLNNTLQKCCKSTPYSVKRKI